MSTPPVGIIVVMNMFGIVPSDYVVTVTLLKHWSLPHPRLCSKTYEMSLQQNHPGATT